MGVDVYAGTEDPDKVRLVQKLLGRVLNPQDHWDYDAERDCFVERAGPWIEFLPDPPSGR